MCNTDVRIQTLYLLLLYLTIRIPLPTLRVCYLAHTDTDETPTRRTSYPSYTDCTCHRVLRYESFYRNLIVAYDVIQGTSFTNTFADRPGKLLQLDTSERPKENERFTQTKPALKYI